MANPIDRNFIIAQSNDLYVPTFHGKRFSFNQAEYHAQGYANATGETVYIWDLDQSVKPHGKPSKEVKPVDIRIGSWCRIYANRGIRDAQILGVIDGIALIEYEMPGGTTALRTVDVNWFDGSKYQEVPANRGAISYNRLPRKWKDIGIQVSGNPQQQKR